MRRPPNRFEEAGRRASSPDGSTERGMPRLGRPRGRLRLPGPPPRRLGSDGDGGRPCDSGAVPGRGPARPARRARHSFRHRIHLWLAIGTSGRGRPPRSGPSSLRGAGPPRLAPDFSIRADLGAWQADRGVDLTGGRVLMPASARVLGHLFNPISVLWCYRSDGPPPCVAAEVHDACGGRHASLPRPDETGRTEPDKEFDVSPFLPVRGRCLFRVSGPDEQGEPHHRGTPRRANTAARDPAGPASSRDNRFRGSHAGDASDGHQMGGPVDPLPRRAAVATSSADGAQTSASHRGG